MEIGQAGTPVANCIEHDTPPTNPNRSGPADQGVAKIDVAKGVLTGILGLLHPEDRVSIVLFSDEACTPLALAPLECMDLSAIKTGIQARVELLRDANCRSCPGLGGAIPQT